MPWIITSDHLDKKAVRVTSTDYLEKNDAELTLRFRLYDDDGILHYSGRMHPNDDDQMSAFAPLDDYGMPNSGCTEIHIFENDQWVTL